MKRFAVSLLTTLSAATFASNWEIDFALSTGLTEQPVANVAVYEFLDGSSETLYAGDGFNVLFGRDLGTFGAVTTKAKIGATFSSISHSEPGINLTDRVFYFPVYVNAHLPVTSKISFGGGFSYLLMPTYQFEINDYSATAKLNSSAGFNLEARYAVTARSEVSNTGVAWVVRYAKNSASYSNIEDSNGDVVDISALRDEEFDALTFGLVVSF